MCLGTWAADILTSSVIYYRKKPCSRHKGFLFICLIQWIEKKLPRSTLPVADSDCYSLGIFPVTNAVLLSFFSLILVNSFFKTFLSPCSLASRSDHNCSEVRQVLLLSLYFIFQVPQNYFVSILLVNICCWKPFFEAFPCPIGNINLGNIFKTERHTNRS